MRRERTARAGYVSGQRERAARVDGAGGRRERAVLEGGAEAMAFRWGGIGKIPAPGPLGAALVPRRGRVPLGLVVGVVPGP